MNNLFWTGKLTFPMKILIESNNLLAWLTRKCEEQESNEGSDQEGV